MSEKINCKKYISSSRGVKLSIFAEIGILCAMLLYFNIISDWQLPGIWYFLLFLIAIPLLFLSSNASRFHSIEIDDNCIKFVPIYNKEDPIIYEWENIKVCSLGKLSLEYRGIPYIGKGIQISYLYGTGVNRSLTSYKYPLGHIANYDDLLKDVQDRCRKYNISFEEIE